MPYTVNQLAKLSGISTRTLRYYDEIGLLKPAYYGDNNYRYYEEAELLLLQQILFYRELGFPLDEIQKVLSSQDFDKIKALQSHKELLQKDLGRMTNLIKTIDKTISHLEGKTMIKLEEIFDGFTDEKQKIYEDYLIEKGVTPKMMEKMKHKVKNWSKEKWLANKKEADELYQNLVDALTNKLSPESEAVQQLIHQHYEMTKQFWTPTKETYIGLSELYQSHPDFVAFYDAIHPDLLNFLMAAMKIYAENSL